MNRSFPLVPEGLELFARKSAPPGMRLEAIHEYTHSDGSPWWYVARWKNPGIGEKRPIPISPCDQGWVRKMPKIPTGFRPLYRLHKLGQYPSELVYLVEGEACADCLEGLGFVATTWPNGAGSIHSVDWSGLANRKVILWPDNDKPGAEAMSRIRWILEGLGCLVVVLDLVPLDLPPKGDCVDWVNRFVKREGARSLHGIPNGHDLARGEIEALEVLDWRQAA